MKWTETKTKTENGQTQMIWDRRLNNSKSTPKRKIPYLKRVKLIRKASIKYMFYRLWHTIGGTRSPLLSKKRFIACKLASKPDKSPIKTRKKPDKSPKKNQKRNENEHRNAIDKNIIRMLKGKQKNRLTDDKLLMKYKRVADYMALHPELLKGKGKVSRTNVKIIHSALNIKSPQRNTMTKIKYAVKRKRKKAFWKKILSDNWLLRW